jgi:hypothetical protein
MLVGYKDAVQVHRHERSKDAPSFFTALAYEIVFQTPASSIFVGFQSAVARMVEENMKELRNSTVRRAEGKPVSGRVLQKLRWLDE